jgi:flagellar hook-associated protein 3 FlgL
MIVNKSMFPLQTGFSVISKMQDKFALLQMQLGTGLKAQTLSDLARDLPVSLSVRSRLTTIAGYSASIEQVDLRLSFYDNALTRLDEIEGQARNSAVQGQYGSSNINMATISGLSKARLDEMVTLLNSDVAGRYLFGGNVTDKAPLPTTNELLDGAGGRAGYRSVVTERQAADLGTLEQGRLTTVVAPLAPALQTDPVTVTLAEDGDHPFGFKLSTVSAIGANIGVVSDFTASPADIEFTFPGDPGTVAEGDSVTLGFTLPDGTETQITLRAVSAANATGATNEFVIGDDPTTATLVTATNFDNALKATLQETAESELKAASTFAASQNFFNAAGEPVLRVEGADPFTATSLRVATSTDTVMWYSGQTAAVSAIGMGRLTSETNAGVVTLTQNSPVSSAHGFQISNVAFTSANAGALDAVRNAGPPADMTVTFDNTQPLTAGDNVVLTLTEPNGTTREVTLTAVTGKAGPGQFTMSSNADPLLRDAENAANFEKAMIRSVTEAASAAEGSPRQSVTAAVEDSGRVAYGMQANESGYLRMMRSLAAMTVETYPEIANAADPNSVDLNPAKKRFDAMARRQQLELSEGRNAERGSIELITMELGVARAALKAAGDRHTNYKAQLDNLLSDVETVSKEDVAMEILALQTRLTASYQVTAMVSQLSLVNYL